MKKITLLLFMLFLSVSTFAQLPMEGFEGTWPPTGWTIFNNAGPTVTWTQNQLGNPNQPPYQGDRAAFLNRESAPAGETTNDWLVTPSFPVPANPELHFFSRLTINGNSGNIYQVRISSNPDVNAQGDYQILQTWTETEINPTQQEYIEKIVAIPASYIGQQVRISFVMMGNFGDRWLIDNVSVSTKCLAPTNLGAGAISQNSANLTWTNPSGSTAWEIAVLEAATAFNGTGTPYNGALPYPATGLTANTAYKFYVRSVCSDDNKSTWAGPFNFNTVSPGSTCASAIPVGALPYSVTGNTSTYGDNIDGSPGATGCGTTSSYLNGDDVFYAYTPTTDGAISVNMTGNGTWAGLFIYNSCANVGVSCVAGGVSGSGSGPVSIPLVSVTAGTTYYIVISTFAAPQSTPYTLTINSVACPQPTNLSVSGLTSTSANLSWAGNGSSEWEIIVQTAGAGAPTGAGATTTTNTNFPATQTTAGVAFTPSTAYEYYVRAACATGGGFSTWSGPFVFNTTQIPGTLTYTDGFEGTPQWTLSNGTLANKWVIGSAVNNGGTQSLYISNNGGAANAYTVGSAAATVHAYRDIQLPTPVNEISISFDWRAVGESSFDYLRVWIVPASFIPTPGTQITAANSGGVQLGANYNQNANWTTTNFVYNASAFAGQTRRLVFEWRNDGSGGTQPPAAVDNINIQAITCSAPSALLASDVTLNSATLSWTAPASGAAGYDYYYSTTSTPPVATTTPNGNVSATTTPLTGLSASTTYYAWVRSNCGPDGTSFWIGPTTISTPQIPGTLTYIDGFEGAAPWTLVNGTQINKWVVGTAVNNGGTQSLYITNDNGVSNAYTINTASVVQAYRDLAIPAGTSEVNLSFDWRAAGESSFDYIRVWLVPTTFNPTPGTQITAANSGGIQLGANYNQNPNWTTVNYIINTAAFAGQNRRLVFEWRNDTSAGTQPPAAIDNVNLSVITCSAPTALTVSNLTDVQATLSWTGPLTPPSGGYDYYYSTTNTAPTATTTPNGNVSATTVDITGLTANTTYYFWVRSNCGDTDGNSFWSGPRAFTTTQVPATLPYTEGFEGTIDWTLVNGTQTNKWVVGTAVSNGGTHSLYISNNNGAAHAYTTSGAAGTVQAYRDILFPAGANEVNLSFDWRAAGESSFDYLRVWLVPATFSPTAGTQITAANSGGTQLGANYNLTPNWTTATYAIDASAFDGQVRRLVFEWRNDGSGGTQPPAAIDNIALSVATCPRPINVEITCSSSTMSNVNWEAGGTETSWEVVVLPATAPAPTSGTVVTEPLYYAEGLTPSSNYTAYVRAICGPGDFSIWREVDFSTGNSSVLESTPFCASQNEGQYILFDNVHDAMNAPEYGDVACLGSTPNPVWYYLQVDSPGNLNFQLIQNTAFNASGNPIGTGLDVDFVAFGPFTSLNEACGQIELEDCPTCPNNTGNANFYPFGNIVDCSYSAAPIENFSIPNAQEGQIYAVLITNFNGDPGQIKLQQLSTSTGSTNCNILYNVDLGENQSYCGAASATITATVTTPGNSEEPNYEWFMDGEEYTPTIVSTTPLTQTISVTEPGIHTYSVVITVANATNTEPITDEVTVALIPAVVVPDPAAIVLCGNGGSASIDLSTLTGGVLGALNPADYVVEYYLTEAAANAGTSPIDITAPFVTTTQTIYVRIESVLLGTCFDVVPLPITVNTSADATIEYADSPYCINELTGVVTLTGTIGGTYTGTGSLVIDPATGTIDIAASGVGTYTVTYTIAGSASCPEFTTTTVVEIVNPSNATISYEGSPYCANGTATVTLEGTTGGAYSSTTGLIIDAATGEIDLAASTPGTYTVTYTMSATADCGTAAVTAEVIIIEVPTAAITYGTAPYCSNGGIADVTLTGTTGGVYSAPEGVVINETTGAIDLAASTGGTYTITYTIPAGSGCPDVDVTASITIATLPEAVFSYDSESFCQNALGTEAPTFDGAAGPGTFEVVPATGLSINPATGVIDPAASDEGTYTVTNKIAAANGCPEVTHSVTVTINPAPIGTFSYGSTAYCQDEETNPSPILAGEIGTFSATPAGLSIDPATGIIDLANSAAGSYTVINTIAATPECAAVNFETTVVISATPVFTIVGGCENNVYSLTVVPTWGTFDASEANYSWTGPSGLVDSGVGVFSIVPTVEGTYTVTVSTASSCVDAQSYPVDSTSCFIQRGISPGDSDKNNEFDLTALNVKHLSIFNRYGQEVYSRSNYTKEWVGQDKKGNELPTGTYFYSIERENGETKTGWVYINRQN